MEQPLVLDRYRPLEELGEGGAGVVVLAWDTRMHRRVAIKRMPLPLDRDGHPVANPPGLAEARTAAMLNHPAIVTVHDFETDDDEAFLVMEHVDGASLDDILDDLGEPLDLDEMAAVFGAVADALDFAHDNGVLHLDIKPANILIARDGRVKVADFGMAAISTAMGHGASVGGTIGYMPLEQLEGMRVSEPTDVWALAAVTYECLTAENPFDDDTIEAAIVRLETQDPRPPTELAPQLPDAIDDVLLAALGLRPADRYNSVVAFADALEPQLGDIGMGKRSLAELVAAHSDDEPEAQTPGFDEVGLWDRLRGRSGRLLVGSIAAVESSWLAWAGLSGTNLDRAGVLAACAMIATAGLLAPPLGTVLGLAAFAIGLFSTGNYLLGFVAVLGGGAWWWFSARHSNSASVIPLSAPALGLLHLSPAAPMIAGFVLPLRQATIAGLIAGLLSFVASAASLVEPPYAHVVSSVFLDVGRGPLVGAALREAFTNPSTYIALAGWPLCAAVMSWFSAKGSRLSAMIGASAASAVLAGAYILADLVSVSLGSGPPWMTTGLAVSVVASLTMVFVAAALGAPVRSEQDGETEVSGSP
ncbi:MAG: serine/threonine protein kinase [Coriobacteriia bacterium]|nr:serine/threonine protein kinase [Coriobacteriia bacterium]